jgi:hypothetical protein
MLRDLAVRMRTRSFSWADIDGTNAEWGAPLLTTVAPGTATISLTTDTNIRLQPLARVPLQLPATGSFAVKCTAGDAVLVYERFDGSFDSAHRPCDGTETTVVTSNFARVDLIMVNTVGVELEHRYRVRSV